MDRRECAESLERCFKGNWFTATNGDEKIASEIMVTSSSIKVGFAIRLKPDCEPVIIVEGRALRSDHVFIVETKGFKATWESVFEITKKKHIDFNPCEGITDTAACEAYDSELRPPAIVGFERSDFGETSTAKRIYAANCLVMIRKPKRGPVTRSCAFCRQCQSQLLRCGKKSGPTTPVKHYYADYSRAELIQALAEKDEKIHEVTRKLRQAEKQLEKLDRLRRRSAAEQCLDVLNAEIDADLSSLPATAALFLQQQFKAHRVSDSRGMRLDGRMIEWAIRLFTKAASAYEFLIESGVVKLPSPRTITAYISKLPACSGLSDTVVSATVNSYLESYQQPYAKFLAMSIDEMKIRANLVYNKKTNDLVGYVDSTETMTALCSGGVDDSQRIATDVLVVYIRGIATDFRAPIVWYPVRCLCAGEIMSVVWTAKRKLEFLSFKDGAPRLKAVSVTCDGLAANHLFFKLHGGGDLSKLQFKATDPLDPPNFLYFIIDPPHLLKTIRNNIEKSSEDENATKYLYFRKPILWRHFEELYLDDVKNTWRLLPKLSHRHIYLTGSDRMKVKLAAQVLSQSVRLALADFAEGTSELCWVANRMFDILNGRHPEEAREKANYDLEPFSSPDDSRLDWLQQVCLGHFYDWENTVNAMDLSKFEKERRLLSSQTRSGIYITINGFVEAVRWILSQPDAPPYILSGVFNQDRLEMYSGHVRSAGGSSDHPDWNRFQRIASVLNYTKTADLAAVRGSNISDSSARHRSV